MKYKMAQKFKDELVRFNYHPTVGFMGVPHLLPGLHKAGLDSEAYRLLLQQTLPSWLFMVKTGKATTIWERWDTWTPQKGFHPDMNSMNHVVWGSVGEFLYREVGGISAMEPGYKKIKINPVVENGISWAETSYQSIDGLIKTSWKTTANSLELNVVIPPNATAEIIIPNQKNLAVYESGKPVSDIKDIVITKSSDGNSHFQVGSGVYNFNVRD